jgi:hypothetical protein
VDWAENAGSRQGAKNAKEAIFSGRAPRLGEINQQKIPPTMKPIEILLVEDKHAKGRFLPGVHCALARARSAFINISAP